jgi:hypothetical protein
MSLLHSIQSPRRERELRAVTRLADGTARPRDFVAFDSYAARSDAAHEQLERHLKVVTLLKAGGPEMPAELRRRLIAEPRRRPEIAPRRHEAWWSPASLRPPVVVACALLVALVATGAWRLSAGGAQAPPTIVRIAMLSFREPTSPPPRAVAGQPTRVDERFAGVTFPDYQRAFGVDAWGQRTDVAGGRTIRTVLYRLSDGVPVSYSVVSGPSLPVPASARQVIVAGVRLMSYRDDRLTFVTLVRDGRTCVLAGTAPAATVLALAAAPLLTPGRV